HKNQLRIEKQIKKLSYIKRLENHIIYHFIFETLRLIQKDAENCINQVLSVLEDKSTDIEQMLLVLSRVILTFLEDDIFYFAFELNSYKSIEAAKIEDTHVKKLSKRKYKLLELLDKQENGHCLFNYLEFNPLNNIHLDDEFISLDMSDIRDKDIYSLLSFSEFGSIGIRWKGISSGHKAFLNLYSSIYNEIKNTKRTTLICIDEGDLYFHPKWQISFFSELLSIISNFN
ncbi:hypothetical protein, partial [Vibrio lentus]|uniref:hypothetical protein n=1 Tax=Vibrio lentus TaxID=136468 RepID=UPI0018E40572